MAAGICGTHLNGVRMVPAPVVTGAQIDEALALRSKAVVAGARSEEGL